MKRIMEQRLQKSAPPLAPQVVRELVAAPHSVTAGPRGSCKAINPETGRQCALLSGHGGAHVHGRTAFTRAALPGQTNFTRRERLDAAATSSFNPTNHLGGIS